MADTGDLFETWSYDRRGLMIFSSREKEWMGDISVPGPQFRSYDQITAKLRTRHVLRIRGDTGTRKQLSLGKEAGKVSGTKVLMLQLGRLKTASGAFGDINYGYDSIGNLLSRDVVGGPDPGVMDLFYVNTTSPLVERVETTPDGQGTTIHDIVHDAMGNILDDGVSRY